MIQDLPQGVASFGGAIDDHMRLIYWICGIWFLIAQGALFYLLFRYRKRDGVRAAWLPADRLRPALFVLVPAALVLCFDLWIEWDSASVWAQVKVDLPPADVRVRVTGRQFAWQFTYPGPDGRFDTGDDVTASEMHVPRNRNVRFELHSADVLHSFYVPELRLKQDVVPGRRIPGWFRATRDGSYTIACAELCGVAHGYMQGRLVVQSPAAFRAWLREEAQP